MRLPIITLSKFVGTVSLGLLTGVSYTLSSITLPSLLFLPTAPSASQTHTYLRTRAAFTTRLLSTLSITSLTAAFLFSPRQARHPYLLWTSLAAVLGSTPAVAEWIVGKRFAEEAHGGNTAGLGVRDGRIEMDESAVMVNTPPTTASGGSESGDDEAQAAVNGEVVRRGVKRGQAVEAARAGIFGLGFLMAVVGVWGDGA